MKHHNPIYIDSRAIFAFCLSATVILLTFSIAQDILIYYTNWIDSNQKIWMFDVDSERSIYTWWSSLLLFVSSVLIFLIAANRRSRREIIWLQWAALGCIFFVLSADEALSFHEKLSGILSGKLNTSGLFFFAWTIPAIVLLVVGFILYIPFLRKLKPHDRFLMLLSGVMFVSGAVGMEILAGSHVEIYGFETIKYRLMTNLEEGLEGIAICLFIFSLFRIAREMPLQFGVAPDY